MNETASVHNDADRPVDRVDTASELSEFASRAADLATDRYVEQERVRRRASLDELIGREQSA